MGLNFKGAAIGGLAGAKLGPIGAAAGALFGGFGNDAAEDAAYARRRQESQANFMNGWMRALAGAGSSEALTAEFDKGHQGLLDLAHQDMVPDFNQVYAAAESFRAQREDQIKKKVH